MNRCLLISLLILIPSARGDEANVLPASTLAPADEAAARHASGRELLAEVDAAWVRPGQLGTEPAAEPARVSSLEDRLRRVVVPSVEFNQAELSRAVAVLRSAALECDPAGRALNLVLVDPEHLDPAVSLSLSDLSLLRILDLVTEAAGFQYEVQRDAVVIRPRGSAVALETEILAVSRAAVLRMSARHDEVAGGPAAAGAPTGEGRMIRDFLQLAGVDFNGIQGSTLAFDGSQLFVTQTAANLQRIRNILARYAELRQVQIEAKFMEVQQGALEELGVQWGATNQASSSPGPILQVTTGTGVTRSLPEAFRNATSAQQITISDGGTGGGLSLPTAAPTLPGGVLVAANAAPLAAISGILGEFDVNAVMRALSQKSGTELLSAPKLTVLSGNPATITVAQEMRYPQAYGQIQSQVGTGSLSGGGSAGVSITSGTPQDFATRNVGVELRVTPTVEEDGRSISMELNPKVTEFEGFVEYGGPSVAISGGTTVTVPPGFYQPIFSVRELHTRVTLWNGATLVMGGLTREDVKKVKDKVPLLGSVPLLGRLFRSRGESTQKRNLLVFVTANLVDPGGAARGRPVARAEPAR